MNLLGRSKRTLAYILPFASLLFIFCFASSAQAQTGYRAQARQVVNTFRIGARTAGQQYAARGQRTQAYVNARRSTYRPTRWRDLPALLNVLGRGTSEGWEGAVYGYFS